MTMFKENGKRSKAWWLQAINWFGNKGVGGIMRGAIVANNHIGPAIEELVAEGLVSVEGNGKTGKGARNKYKLTPEGHVYLNENTNQLEDPNPTAQTELPIRSEAAQSGVVHQVPVMPTFSKRLDPVEDTPAPVADIVRPPVNEVKTPVSTPVKTVNQDPAAMLREAMGDILIKKYGHAVTGTELMAWFEARK